jgi:hypothetical protein
LGCHVLLKTGYPEILAVVARVRTGGDFVVRLRGHDRRSARVEPEAT